MFGFFQASAKILVILLIITSVNVMQYFGQPQPRWWEWCLNNRLYASILIFVMSNTIEGHLMASGAFEILFNGN